MKIYKDKELNKELIDNTFELGIVLAGETKTFTFYVFNDDKALLKDLEFTVAHKEVEILEFPKELMPEDVGELTIKWSPSITLKEGLRASLKIKYRELWD